jgi:hypothetical protein
MATHSLPYQYPSIIQHAAACRNNMVPDAAYVRRLANGLNHVVAFRRKAPLMFCRPMNAVPANTSDAAVTHWHAYITTGYGVNQLAFRMGLMKASSGTLGTTDPYVKWNVGGTDTDELHYSAIDAAKSDVADEIMWGEIRYAVSSNTAYPIYMQAVGRARPLCALVYEIAEIPVDDTNTGVSNPSITPGTPILDAQSSDLALNGTELWQQNAAHVFSWTSDIGTASPAITATSYTNILDETSTSHSAATPGVQFDLTYMNSFSRTTVPCVLAVRASSAVGTSANNAVRLYDGSTAIATVSSIGTSATWYTATANIATGSLKVDIQAQANSGDTVTVDAVTLYQHE